MLSQRSKLMVKLAQKISQDNGSTHWEIIQRENASNTVSSNGGDLEPNNNTAVSFIGENSNPTQAANIVATHLSPEINCTVPTISMRHFNDSSSSDDNNVDSAASQDLDPFYNSDDEDSTYSPSSVNESSSQSDNSTLSMQTDTETSQNETKNSNAQEAKRTRKRKRNETEWKKNAAKLARNYGREYESSSKSKKVIKAREMKPPCKDSCKLKCNSNITAESRKQIFKNYWALGDLQRQRDYLSSSLTPIKPKYQYHRNEAKRRDNNSFHFAINGSNIRVCKSYFKSTLDITDRPIRTVINKRNAVGGMLLNDLRGKHGKHPKLEASIKGGIRQHINSIPRIESHYTRARSSREFIEGGKSLRDLHRDYVEECIEKKLSYGKYLIYHQIFNREFNISFFTPKKDQCAVCAAYTNSSEEDKENLNYEYENHLSEKQMSRAEKQADKHNISENYLLACFDLQAVMPCPRGETSTFYYKSKLNVLNFTVYEITQKALDDQCYCYIWDETQGQRGANEIGSCLLSYIEEKSKANPDGNLKIVLYSDNCVGQQKNRYILSMYIYALMKYTNIKCITHKFLIVGHTQNEGDSAHSVIERQIKRSLKSGPFFLPAEYVGLIKSAKKNGRPYLVREMSFRDFVDLKRLNEKIGNIDCRGNNEKMSDMKIIKIEKEDPFKIYYKTTYADKNFSVMNIRRPRTTRNKNDNLTLQALYKEKIKIADKKKKGLLELLAKNHIPSRHAEFYNNL